MTTFHSFFTDTQRPIVDIFLEEPIFTNPIKNYLDNLLGNKDRETSSRSIGKLFFDECNNMIKHIQKLKKNSVQTSSLNEIYEFIYEFYPQFNQFNDQNKIKILEKIKFRLKNSRISKIR